MGIGVLVAHARKKLARKGCDMVVANLAEHGFEGDDNAVTRERAEALDSLPKREVAGQDPRYLCARPGALVAQWSSRGRLFPKTPVRIRSARTRTL